jgi:hypothetical protein
VTAISDAGNDTAASQYVLKVPPRTQPGRSFDLEGGKRGVLLGTRRAVIGARGGTPLLVEDEVAIRQVVALPEPDGFLFFTSLGVSRAKGFADPLEPLAIGSVEDVQVGPGFVLVRKASGRTTAIDLATGQPKKGLPLGLALVAASPSVAIGLAHGGRMIRSTDRGATWKDVSRDQSGNAHV